MQQASYDVVVIGAGPGGYVAAIRLAQLGLKVACVEKDKTLGGTCLNVGCIPSKALLQSTEQYEWLLKSSKDHGISAKDVSIDFNMMMQRKLGIVKGLVDGIASQFKKLGIVRLQGIASFLSSDKIDVNGEVISAKYFIIATGSKPIELPFLKFDEKIVVSSTGALSLETVPKRLLVVGGGVIGVELASVYKRLGAEVIVVEMLDTLTPAMDSSISRALLQVLKKQGIEFYLSAKVTGALVNQTSVELSVEYEGNPIKLQGDVALVAIGRKPFTEGLNLQAAGVNMSVRGLIDIDKNFRTSQSNIFAIGDVIEGVMLAHRASHEGMAVAELIAGNSPQINYMAIPNVVYTHPEVSSVGLTEAEAKAAGLKTFSGTSYFKGNGRARCSGDTDGFVKVIGDSTTGRLLGMHIIGAHASELIAEGMIAIEKKATLADLADAPNAHPTLSETIMEASQQALGRAIHG